MSRPRDGRTRWVWGSATTVLLLVVVVAYGFWPRPGQVRAEAAHPVGAPTAADGRAAVLSAARREIAELSGNAGADRSRRLDDSTGALHEAVAREGAVPGGGVTAVPGTVTAVATTALDADTSTADLIATVQSPSAGEQRLAATMALVGGSWKLSALSAVPVGADPVAVPAGAGVTADVGGALARILSYSPSTAAATAQAADQVLAGAAATQYRQLLGAITAQVRQQGLSVDSRVVRIGVEQQTTADRAQLLVFLDQTARRNGGARTRVGAQLSVTAQLSGGHWRIVALASI
ncbi:hypothetical protein ACEZCY_06350 [Streptacidiphilus sp. N1-12]|uniref:Uncharacterized protein n=2 Tax=Streptacidiphilus alkalitolerans TaxID=3342712 RepID=A0ABV6W9X9_9ACTN